MHIGNANAAELGRHPSGRFGVSIGAGDPSPKLMTLLMVAL
jgi:hypothetical protein